MLDHYPVRSIRDIDRGSICSVLAPVVRGRKTWSMFRQVRFIARLLVLIGVALGWQVHPGFYGLSAFVGAGLLFSGITDFCGMALILARCPWNR